MKAWVKQLREFLSVGHNWVLFENDPNHFEEWAFGDVDYTTVTLRCHGRINGIDWSEYMSNVADLINTYILPHYTGSGKDGWHYGGQDSGNMPYWIFYQYFPGLDNPFVNSVDFIIQKDVDKIYTQAEIDNLKTYYPAELVDALGLKTEADKKSEESERDAVETGKFPFIITLVAILVTLWILDD